jgi:hypothetical protein
MIYAQILHGGQRGLKFRFVMVCFNSLGERNLSGSQISNISIFDVFVGGLLGPIVEFIEECLSIIRFRNGNPFQMSIGYKFILGYIFQFIFGVAGNLGSQTCRGVTNGVWIVTCPTSSCFQPSSFPKTLFGISSPNRKNTSTVLFLSVIQMSIGTKIVSPTSSRSIREKLSFFRRTFVVFLRKIPERGHFFSESIF